MSRRRILCFASYYLPGFKGGGPVRSLSNLCEWLGDDYDFRIVTRDRDIGDVAPYADRSDGGWFPETGAMVRYLEKPYWSPQALQRAVRSRSRICFIFTAFSTLH